MIDSGFPTHRSIDHGHDGGRYLYKIYSTLVDGGRKPTMSPITPPPSATSVALRSSAVSMHLSRMRLRTDKFLFSSPSGNINVSTRKSPPFESRFLYFSKYMGAIRSLVTISTLLPLTCDLSKAEATRDALTMSTRWASKKEKVACNTDYCISLTYLRRPSIPCQCKSDNRDRRLNQP
jgi:hypothetical protein